MSAASEGELSIGYLNVQGSTHGLVTPGILFVAEQVSIRGTAYYHGISLNQRYAEVSEDLHKLISCRLAPPASSTATVIAGSSVSLDATTRPAVCEE